MLFFSFPSEAAAKSTLISTTSVTGAETLFAVAVVTLLVYVRLVACALVEFTFADDGFCYEDTDWLMFRLFGYS